MSRPYIKYEHLSCRQRSPSSSRIKWLLFFLVLKIVVAFGTKCHTCLFHLSHCTNPLDCYNQPDTCSNTNFSPLLTQTIDCDHGCEQYVITDATGSVVLWRRGCASERSPKSSYICFSRNIYFLRHEQCWCHSDYCNDSSGVEVSHILIVLSLTVTLLSAAAYRQ